MSNLRTLDLAVIALYFAGVAFIGFWFARRQNSTETYYVARRAVPHWAMGLSMFATIISSITFIAYPGSAYAGNWNEIVPGFMVLGVLILAGAVLIPFFRHAVGMSAYEYFEKRFGYGARVYSSLAFIAWHFSKMGFVVYLLSLTITGMTGWNVYAVIIISGLVTVLYTLFGGMEAVIWTQVVQGIVKGVGVLVIIGVLLWIMPGGAGAAFHLAAAHDKFSLGSCDLNLSQKGNIFVMSLYGFFFYLQKYAADQTLVQRYLVAKSDRDALKGVVLGAVLCVPAWAAFMLVGTLLWAYFQLSGEALPAHLHDAAGKIMPDKVFPFFLATKIPVGFAGLFMAALLSAGMSTMSSDLNCLSAVGIEDYYRKLRPASTDPQRLAAGKIIVAVCGLLTIGIAALIAWRSDRSLSLYYAVSSIIAAGLAGMFLLAFLSRRANRQGLWIGLAAALLFTAWATLTSGNYKLLNLGWNYTWPDVMIGVIAHVIVLTVGWLASWFFPAESNLKKEWTLWGWRERQKELSAEGIKLSVCECPGAGRIA
jgi:SSS family solute:Na+ symporter